MTLMPWWRWVFDTSMHNNAPLIVWWIHLLAIEGYVSNEMLKAIYAFLEFCYIAHHNIHDTCSLEELHEALQCYYHYCEIFMTTANAFAPDLTSLTNTPSFITLRKSVYMVFSMACLTHNRIQAYQGHTGTMAMVKSIWCSSPNSHY